MDEDQSRHFLVMFDRRADHIIRMHQYADATEANDAYVEMEKSYAHDENLEIESNP